MAIHVIKEPAPPPGKLKKPELYALSIGQVIGAGVITLIVPAIKMTGYSAWLAYFVAIIMGFIMIAPTVFVSSTLRLGGGYYSLLCDLAGPKASGVFAFAYLTQCLSLSLFGTAAAAYLGDVVPALGGNAARIIVGISLLTLFYVINLMGIEIMAKAQKVMTWLLIAALLVFAVIGIAKIHLPIFDFSDPNFLTQGWGISLKGGQVSGGFLGAAMLFVYSCQGYSMTSAYGRDAHNAKRDIPWAILASVPTLIVLYVGVAMAGTGVMSISEYGNSSTLVFAAQRIFPAWLFYAFIIGGPIMALLSTLNSSFAYNAILIGQSCDDGWLPMTF
ncbi:MAG: APC family permease, partial [Clostridiaceae bacterium]|nr:APC family permease [Clostridiaceae bacterium]